MTVQELDTRLARLIEVERLEREDRDRRLHETDELLRELRWNLDKLGEKFGGFAERMALPSMQRVLFERFRMDVVMPRVHAHRNGRVLELDALAYSESNAYVVEVKSHLREEAIDQLRKILQEFRDFFPMHQDKKVYGILAAVDTPDDVRDKALREGFYLARIHDGQFEMQVPDGFQPRAF
jgi:hypothetical protein